MYFTRTLVNWAKKSIITEEVGEWDVVDEAFSDIMQQLFTNVSGFNTYKLTDIVKTEESFGV